MPFPEGGRLIGIRLYTIEFEDRTGRYRPRFPPSLPRLDSWTWTREAWDSKCAFLCACFFARRSLEVNLVPRAFLEGKSPGNEVGFKKASCNDYFSHSIKNRYMVMLCSAFILDLQNVALFSLFNSHSGPLINKSIFLPIASSKMAANYSALIWRKFARPLLFSY